MEQRPVTQVSDIVFGTELQDTSHDMERGWNWRSFEKTGQQMGQNRMHARTMNSPGIKNSLQKIFDIDSRVMKDNNRTAFNEGLALWLLNREHISEYRRSCCEDAASDSKDSVAGLKHKAAFGEPKIVDAGGSFVRPRFLTAGRVHLCKAGDDSGR